MFEIWLQHYNKYITHESIWDWFVTPFICHMYWLGGGLTSHLNEKFEVYLHLCYNTYWKTTKCVSDPFIVSAGVRFGTVVRYKSTCHQIYKHHLPIHLLNQGKDTIKRKK